MPENLHHSGFGRDKAAVFTEPGKDLRVSISRGGIECPREAREGINIVVTIADDEKMRVRHPPFVCCMSQCRAFVEAGISEAHVAPCSLHGDIRVLSHEWLQE